MLIKISKMDIIVNLSTLDVPALSGTLISQIRTITLIVILLLLCVKYLPGNCTLCVSNTRKVEHVWYVALE